MSSKDKGKGGPGGRRREPPIIDLAPTAVRTGPAADTAGAGPSRPSEPEGAAPPPPASEPIPDVAPAAATAAASETSAPAAEPPPAFADATVAETPAEPRPAASSEPASERPTTASEPASDSVSPEPWSTAPMSESSAASPATAPSPPPAGAGSPGYAVPLAAALVGGLIGIGGSYLLASGGRWPDQTGPVITELAAQKTKVADLEKKLATMAPVASVSALDTRVQAAEKLAGAGPSGDFLKKLEAIEKGLADKSAALEAMARQLDENRTTDLQLRAAVARAVDPARVEEIERKFLAELATARGTASEALAGARTALAAEIGRVETEGKAAAAKLDAADKAFASRMDETDKAVSGRFEVTTKAAATALATEIKGVDKRIADLGNEAKERAARLEQTRALAEATEKRTAAFDDYRKTVDVLFARVATFDDLRRTVDAVAVRLNSLDELRGTAEANASAINAAGRKIEAVTARIGELDKLPPAVKAFGDRAAAIEAKSAALGDKITEVEAFARRGADARADAVLALTLGGLKAVVDDGRPFQTELATVKSLGRGTIDLSVLEPYAATGVPTTPVLIERFPNVARAILLAVAAPPAGTESVMDKLMAGAMSSVTVRKVGDTAGDGPEARVARMEDRLKTRDLAGAVAEWKALPEAGRKASADWGAAVEARLAVDKAISAVTSSVVSKLVPTGQ